MDASKAVDGLKTNLSFSGYQCTESANVKYEALWRVDLGTVLGIHHITMYYRTDNQAWGRYMYKEYTIIPQRERERDERL